MHKKYSVGIDFGTLSGRAVLVDKVNTAVYDKLYEEYKRLYTYYGCGENPVMKTQKKLKSVAESM